MYDVHDIWHWEIFYFQLKSLSKSINSAAASVSKEVDHLSRDVNHAFDSSKSSLLLVSDIIQKTWEI